LIKKRFDFFGKAWILDTAMNQLFAELHQSNSLWEMTSIRVNLRD